MSEPLAAYLFENESENMAGVCLTPDATGLPALKKGDWVLRTKFALAVDQPTSIGMNPEPILRGLAANGYFIWSRNLMKPFGTSQ